MSPKLAPDNPENVMVTREIDSRIVTCSVPFSRFGVLKIGGRGTIVRMNSGCSAVFSPVALTEHVKGILAGLDSPVKYIIAPDIEHHIFLSQWKKSYPDAKIIGPEGLKEKREKNPDTKDAAGIDFIFTPEKRHDPDIYEEFNAEFDTEYVPAHPNREIAVLHKPTRTLIQADLFFNLPANQQYEKTGEGGGGGFLTKLFTPIWSTQGSAIWQKRFVWYFLASDRESFRKSVREIEKWDFDRIIPCHGDVIETGGKEVFRNLFEWFLKN